MMYFGQINVSDFETDQPFCFDESLSLASKGGIYVLLYYFSTLYTY